ncbi:hypothetical protein BDN71DRAFT_1479609 [Pleurotus eryngii]|uniref:Uncharacterized protein n=1 Tax=Pleurotus eryngii TaxID=5323 RepID=A0A9P6A7U2_PLEER|nr:hypothetical protein BDN71DRAFT_1479609 [Pleurotus eryngii]
MENIPTFDVPGLHHCSLTGLMNKVFSYPDTSCEFHYVPYKQYFQPPPNDDGSVNNPICVYDEIYSSDAMLDAHVALQELPPKPRCSLEHVVASILLYSDSTHLASFRMASAWPIYPSFGNQSKYVHCRPWTGACQHLAYIPKLMHAIWWHLLDDNFQHAYEHGMVVKCPNGIEQTFYPRIFTYSTDYPKKLQRSQIAQTCEWIYATGQAIKSKAVELVLGPQSEVPTVNIFSEQLAHFGFDFHQMFVPDLLHEVELSTWKALFTHLIYILVANSGTSIQKLNDRCADIVTCFNP